MYTWMRIYMQPIVRLKWTKCFFFLSFLSLQDERSQHESVLPDSFPASRYRLWFVVQKRSAMRFLSFLFLPSKYLFVPGVSHTHTHTHTLLPSWLACRSPCDRCGHSSAGIPGTLHAPECTADPWSLGGQSRWRPRSPHAQSSPCSWSLGPGSYRSRCKPPVSSRWNISPHRTRSVFLFPPKKTVKIKIGNWCKKEKPQS